MSEKEKKLAQICIDNPELIDIYRNVERQSFIKGFLAGCGGVTLGAMVLFTVSKMAGIIGKD